MKKLYFLFGSLLLAIMLVAQPTVVRCYSHEHLEDQIRQNPERGRSLEALDRKVDELVAARISATASNNATNAKKPGGGGGGTPRTNVVYIPVVVNVVWNTAAEKISEQQIQSQIDVLNKDYSAQNIEILNAVSGSYDFAGYYGVVADCKIQFCLYKIVYKNTTVTSFGTNDAMKKTSAGGQDPTNPTTMLNMWSCNMGGGILGYAQFPGGNANTDGVVILYSAFGTSAKGATATNYDEGRTATHEIGHWLGLRHIWGDRRCGDDYVGDTPLHDGANNGCPDAGHRSTCTGKPLEQYMNYMDYSYDKCMYMFSKGQLARMDGYITASRAPYCLTGCPAPVANTDTRTSAPARAQLISGEAMVYPTVASDFAYVIIPSVTRGNGEVTVTSQSGKVMRRSKVALSQGSTRYSLQVGDLPNGMYILRIAAADGTIQTRKLVVQH